VSNHPICSYQDFDPVSLAARSAETERRLADLDAVIGLVAGKTVLDIGCNGGLVAALALRSGALSVVATDVNPDFVDATRDVLRHHAGTWEARVVAAGDLRRSDRAQVTFFLEVYHWLIHQGMDPEHVADILDDVTAECIVIEAPWDSRDPSVANSLKGMHYSLPELLRALGQRGFAIRLTGFATYFPAEYERPLFVCTRALTAADPAQP